MGSHPLNLGLRFLLELTALIIAGILGWRQADNGLKFVWAIGLPLLLAVVWVTFAVPDDPSRSGHAPVAVQGMVRLAIELCILGFAPWALYQLGHHWTSVALAAVTLVHYLLSYDRVVWLLSQ